MRTTAFGSALNPHLHFHCVVLDGVFASTPAGGVVFHPATELCAAVCSLVGDRPGLERLLRYCARPPFALERLQQRDAEHLLYENPRSGPGGRGPQTLTPLELIDRLAALVPPPRVHRHRYYGVLAPNSPLRAAVTALAMPAATLAPAAPPLSVCFLDFLRPLRVDRHVSNGS